MDNRLFFILKSQSVLEFLRFGIVGFLATGTHYLIYFLSLSFMAPGRAYTLGYFLSFLANLLLTTFFTFKVRFSIRKSMGFIGCHLTNYLLQMLLLNLFLYVQIPSKLAPLPTFLIAIPINFLLVRFVFKTVKHEKDIDTHSGL